MNKDVKILITGRYGQVGSAIERVFRNNGFENIVGERSRNVDLRDREQTDKYFDDIKPDIVISAAAKVGGIKDNSDHPADFLIENLEIQNNVIRNCYRIGAKLVFIASNCIYPDNCPRPIEEEYLFEGKLNGANEGYGLAKLVGVKLCEYYNRQYKTDYISVVASNVYGIGDDFSEDRAHVVPAMIRRRKERMPSFKIGMSVPLH